jgi:tRNA(Ile)-lysidine synthase
MNFSPEQLLPDLLPLGNGAQLVVAYSGGLDSMVVLHSLHHLIASDQLTGQLSAIHVNHGISSAADDWEAFCKASCHRLDVPLQIVTLDLGAGRFENLEQRARTARYTQFEALLDAGQTLILGHHRDDQMETLMYRLMRGSGPRGMASMPMSRPLGEAKLLRPLLKFSRTELLQYAIAEGLNWVEDESNQSLDFDRNFIRHELLPLVEHRWPDYRKIWEKSIVLSREADMLLAELAAGDLAKAAPEIPQVLELGLLLELSEPRQRNLLRHWFDVLGFPAPGWQSLQKLTNEIIPARADSVARLQCPGGYLQRYRNRLYALAPEPEIDIDERRWNSPIESSFDLAANGEIECARQGPAKGEARSGAVYCKAPDSVTVRYRQGGELFQSVGRPAKSVKKLMQEMGVAPWLRHRYPLIFCEDELICIPGIGISHQCVAEPGQDGCQFLWHAPAVLFNEQRS